MTDTGSTPVLNSPESSGELPSDSSTGSDSDDEVPQPEFERIEDPTLEELRSEPPDVDITPSDVGLENEQSQLEIKSSRLGSRRKPAG